ncbi:MAG TPA: hypothetical protein VJ653_03600 [Acidimicrobiales bacterium]|nr:hypothetical protein [Acidimicrobiales bacterium]
MRMPQIPPTTMAAKAAARAFTGGSAVGPPPRSQGRSGPGSGNRNDSPGSGTRRS